MRVESISGTTLYAPDDMVCRGVRGIKNDAHGNPIPIVTQLAYDVTKVGFELTELRVSFFDDTVAAAETNAKAHRTGIGQATADPIRGQNSLCMILENNASLSCQLVSPYPGDAALVVYCDEMTCKMPLLAMNKHMAISATWEISDSFWSQPKKIGKTLIDKVQSINEFLEPLSSGV